MKKLICMLLSVALVLSFAACGKAPSGGNEAKETESGKSVEVKTDEQVQEEKNEMGLVNILEIPNDETRKSTKNTNERYPHVEYAQGQTATELQPFNFSDNAKNTIRTEIYECLLDRVGAEEYVGRLAKNWEYEDDTHIVVEIYDYIVDCLGNEITAEDVKFSYELTANSGYAQSFDNFDSIDVIDTYKVRIALKAPMTVLNDFYFIMCNVAIVDEGAYAEYDFSTEPKGTGPYVISEFVNDGYVQMVVNENYWQTDELCSVYAKRNVEEIRINFVKDAAMRLILLEEGKTIYNSSLPAADLHRFMEGGDLYGKYTMTECNYVSVTSLLPNMSGDSPLSDVNLRLACYYAVDTAAIVKALGTGATAVKVLCSPNTRDYNAEWSNAETYCSVYDPELAKEYLAKSNYKGEVLKLRSDVNQNKATIAQIVQQYLKQVGIESEVIQDEFVMYTANQKDSTAWDFLIANGGDINYAAATLNTHQGVAKGKVEGLNLSLQYDETLEKMISELNTVEGNTVENKNKAMDYIMSNALEYPIYSNYFIGALGEDVCDTCMWIMDPSIPLLGAWDYYLD